MPSASPPDGPPSGLDGSGGEVVEVFTGDTLEEAMAAAVAALGPELTVRRARKVRAGVRGLLGKDRYEVLAVPPEGPAPLRAAEPDDDRDAVGSALEALLEAADEREAGGPAARPVGRPSSARPLAARPSSDDLPPPLRAAAPGAPAPLPPAPRSGGSPLRRMRSSAPLEEPQALTPRADEPSRARNVRPAPERGRPEPTRPEPVEAEVEERSAADPAPSPRPARRRGRTLGLPLSGRAPHPDPAVADHPEPAPVARPRVLDARAPEQEPEQEPDEEELEVEELEVEELPPPPRRTAPPAAAAAPAAAAPAAAAPAPTAPAPAAPAGPTTPAAPAARRAGTKKAAPVKARRSRAAGWSRSALAGVGVPEAVLDALPEPAPRDDLAWVVALTAAIEATVPPPAEPDEQTPVVLSGHGVTGVVAVLDAGCRGIAPGTISHAGRTAPATATELALVLRHHVTGGA